MLVDVQQSGAILLEVIIVALLSALLIGGLLTSTYFSSKQLSNATSNLRTDLEFLRLDLNEASCKSQAADNGQVLVCRSNSQSNQSARQLYFLGYKNDDSEL